jgi:hypothetical protein
VNVVEIATGNADADGGYGVELGEDHVFDFVGEFEEGKDATACEMISLVRWLDNFGRRLHV